MTRAIFQVALATAIAWSCPAVAEDVKAPQGQREFKAAGWVTEPTYKQLAPYVPREIGPGWAQLKCQTKEHFRVEHCEPVSEAPSGSGLAKALCGAEGKFRVRPPEINGVPAIGSWVLVQIHFGGRQ